MQLLVDGKLYKTSLDSPGIVVALNVLPLDKTYVEAATLRYVQNVMRESFNGHRNAVHHQKLIAALERIGGMSEISFEDSLEFPGIIALNASAQNWRYSNTLDLLGLMLENFLTGNVMRCLSGSVFYDKFEHETIFNVRQQTEERLAHVIQTLHRVMDFVGGATRVSLNAGEVAENGNVNLHYSIHYGDTHMYQAMPTRGKKQPEKWINWMRLNFVDHVAETRAMDQVDRLNSALQWLPEMKI